MHSNPTQRWVGFFLYIYQNILNDCQIIVIYNMKIKYKAYESKKDYRKQRKV